MNKVDFMIIMEEKLITIFCIIIFKKGGGYKIGERLLQKLTPR